MIRRAGKRIAGVLDPRHYFGPIFYKEMLVAGRRSFTHWARFFAGALLTLLLWAMITGYTQEVSYRQNTGIERLREYEQLALVATYFVGWTMFAVLPLIAAALGSGTILDEKKARTMPSLLSTPMSPWSIVASKVTSRITQILIIALIGLPVLLAARTYGGLSAQLILAFYSVGVSMAILAASVATHTSLTASRAWGAMLTAVFVVLGVNALPFIPIWFLAFGFGNAPWLEQVIAIAGHISPAGAMAATIIGPDFPGARFAPFEGSFWVGASLTCLLLSALSVWATALRLRTHTTGKSRAKVKRDQQGNIIASKGRRKRRWSRTIIGNPVAWRELRQPMVGGKRIFRWILTAVAALALLWIYLRTDPTERALHMWVVMLCVVAASIIPLIATTTSISTEREARTLDVLLTTPMSAWSIVLGKLVGAFRKPIMVMGLASAHVLLFVVVGLIRGQPCISLAVVPHLLLTIIGTCALCGSTGLLFGVLCKRGSVAMICNILLWAFLWGGIFFLVASLRGFGGGDDGPERLLFLINPFFMCGMATYGGTPEPPWGSYGGTIVYDYDMGPLDWDLGLAGFSAVVGIVCVASVAAGLGVTWITAQILASRTQRRA